ncbi:hypothetical protein GALL_153290 [mine drainage metagenome]|uniref:Uncharacterized protein n=1 Tax=mine drainage metagenome TaxID=410659 RepID=A0A1J5S2Y8_9ZZZZ
MPSAFVPSTEGIFICEVPTVSQDTGNAVEQTPEQIRADMEAGFNEATTGTVPTETPASQSQPVAPEAPAAKASDEAPPAAQPVEAAEPLIAGFKESELKNLLSRISEIDEIKGDVRKVYGQYGGLKNFIDEKLKTLPTQTVAGVTRINPKALERLKSEYGPELAEIFNDFIESSQAQPEEKPAAPAAPADPVPTGIDPAEFERRLAEETARIAKTADERVAVHLIDFKHPDRAQIRETPEFKTWIGTLPPADADAVVNTWDVNVLSGKLDQFKAWNAKRISNEKRLKGALTPKGVQQTPPAMISEEDAIRQGFDSVFEKT